ncbi:hypothetical protein GCM10009794_02050 [Rothia terrae]
MVQHYPGTMLSDAHLQADVSQCAPGVRGSVASLHLTFLCNTPRNTMTHDTIFSKVVTEVYRDAHHKDASSHHEREING